MKLEASAWDGLTESKEPMGFAGTNEISLVSELTDKWAEALEHSPATHDVDFAERIHFAMTYPQYIDKPVLVPASPGFGKSTMIKTYLLEMLRREPDTFGAIVVREKIEDLIELEDAINVEHRGSRVVVKRRAYRFKGFDPQRMTFDEYVDQYTEQLKYNVVLMTTKQLELQALAKNLGTFANFEDLSGHSRPRQRVVIDEKPNLVVTESFSYEDLTNLEVSVYKASKRVHGKKLKYVRKTHDLIDELKQQVLNVPDGVNRATVEPIEFKYTLPSRLLADFKECFSIREIQRLRTFERVIGYGGEINTHNGNARVTASYRMDYDLTQFNSFIFDGTSNDDLTYSPNRYYVIEQRHEELYKNFHIHVCRQFPMSINAIDGKDESLQKMAQEAQDIASWHEGKTLVGTHSNFKEQLEGHIESDDVEVKYFNGGRGTNKYRDFRNVVLFGALDKGPDYYSTTVKALLDGIIESQLSDSQHQENGRSYSFDAPEIEQYRVNDKATSTTQEVHRIRPYTKSDEVHFYFFMRDENVIDEVVERFPGCQVHEHTTYRKLNGKETKADDIIRAFEWFVESVEESVKGKEIYQKADTTSKNLRETVNGNERVRGYMERHGIEKKGHSFVKIKGGGDQ